MMNNKSKFNNQQLSAIEADINEDVLISACAGSGKTNTLSERVCNIILDEKIKPSELLVLTFSNNAAHEMKERILSKFPKDVKEKADKLLSTHIQTFDSLYKYLVSQYSSELGLSDNVNLIQKTVETTKRREICDELFDEYYNNSAKVDYFVDFISKYDLKSDRNSKKLFLDLWVKLDSLGTKNKNDFIAHYAERYYSFDFCKKLYHDFTSSLRKIVIDSIYKAAFAEYFYDIYSKENTSLSSIKKAFSSVGFWGKKYDSFSFSDDKYAEPLYQAILKILSLDDEDFIKSVQTFKKDNEKLLSSKTKGLPPEDQERLEAPWKILKSIFLSNSSLIKNVNGVSDIQEEYKRILNTKNDVDILLSLIKEADLRFINFKKSINAFSFSDIADYALAVLTDDKYEHIAEEIRSRFSYIMVDEYQDTNETQEAFLDSLLKPNKDGKKAHLFVVGDAKQSIYLFRGSVVALFKNRQNKYLNELGKKVITMNYNYRSGKHLLNDINYICSYYMRLDHGCIDYKNDESEKLDYDENVNIYSLPYENFGISRIITPNLPLIDIKTKANERNQTEAFAILKDIKQKLNDGYLVYDKKEGIRPCRQSDFAILMSVRGKYGLYEKLFTQNGLKLNKIISSNLREMSSILLIESLIKLFKWMCSGGDEDPKHLFTSIARSYAFEYSDTDIYNILIKCKNDDLKPLTNDPLWKKLECFVYKYDTEKFSNIFLALIDEFHVIDKLYKIGNIEENVAKIDSLYNMIVSNESIGMGISDFVNLFANMSRYSLNFDTETLTKNEDAVDMMTIHASKGLERKIVYMPVSLNAMHTPTGLEKPIFSFSLERGLGLPDYSFSPNLPASPNNNYETTFETLLTRKIASSDDNLEIDDHVRLFYVALTRAENQIIIVGDDDKRKENLYSMYNELPHYLKLNDYFFKKKINEGIINQKEYDDCLSHNNEKDISLPLLNDTAINDEAKGAYLEYGKEFYLKTPLNIQIDYLNKFARKIYIDYETRLFKENDLDIFTRAFIYKRHPLINEKYNIDSFSSLLSALEEERKEQLSDQITHGNSLDNTYMDEIGIDEELPKKEQVNPNVNYVDICDLSKEELIECIINFAKSIANEDYEALNISIKFDKKDDKKEKVLERMLKEYLPCLLFAFDNESFLAYISYENGGFADKVSFINQSYKEKINSKIPDFSQLNVNDDELDFEKRSHIKASKTLSISKDNPSNAYILDRGTYLHHLLELCDISSGDTSFIKNKNDKEIIDKTLSLPIMKLAKNSKIYSEYGYFDYKSHSFGYIDLLFEKEGQFYIVDYKTSNIDDDSYVDQLHLYQENVSRLFKVDPDNIHLYLISILKTEQKEIF